MSIEMMSIENERRSARGEGYMVTDQDVGAEREYTEAL